jgi:RND superfamily putative drug exporter
MESLLGKLAQRIWRRRVLVALLWLVVLVLAAPLAAAQTKRLSGGGWDVPGSQSARARSLLAHVSGHEGERFAVFVEGANITAAAARAQAILARHRDVLRTSPTEPLARGAALIPVGYVGPRGDVYDFLIDLRKELVRDADGTHTRVVGEAAMWSNFQTVSKSQLSKAESIGFPLILIILLAAFGTAIAAFAPLAIGIVAVVIAGAVTWALAGPFEISIFVTNAASMIGIGVAVDYSLFVVGRYRRRLRDGEEPREALRDALSSAGTAVVYSGATVAVSLTSLFLVNVNAIRSMAVGAIAAVVVAVIAAVTLLPALLALTGRRIERFRVPYFGTRGGEGEEFWARWSERIMRRPVVAVVSAAAAMLLLAAPVLSIETRNGARDQLPRRSEVGAATAELARVAGPGALGPVQAITPTDADASRLAEAVRSLPNAARVTREGTLVQVVPSVDPESAAAHRLLGRVKALAPPNAVIGGVTQFADDEDGAVFGGLWKMILFILALSFCVLLALLRSLLLPLKAVVMNVLSVAAAYGVLVAIFQWGWLDWTGYDSPGYIDTIVPVLLLAITFGLSMDYEVFLLTRIRERYLASGDARRSVAEGLALSARTITAAALVMVAVFGAFALAGATSIKELGTGLAVAIAVDATIVRLVLVPGTMELLGEWNWWLPFGDRRPEQVPSDAASAS